MARTTGALALSMLLSAAAMAQMPPAGGGNAGAFEMPDMKQMSGIPRPVGDLPNGSVSVRVIRGSLTNNVAGQPVELQAAGKTLTVKTDESGRAEFDKLPVGAAVKATTVVDGERLETQEFPVPPTGGIRVLLVATDKNAAPAPPAPTEAVTGTVVLGAESRIVMEPGDEAVQLYYILDIVNTARAPVNTAQPFVFRMPTEAVNTTILEGSSPQAAAYGTEVRVKGPFAPGRTVVQVACELPSLTGAVGFEQTFPATLEGLFVVVKKVGAVKLTAPQAGTQKEMTSDGQIYIGAQGGAVAAGTPVKIALDDLPHHNPAPRWFALGIAMSIFAIGALALSRPVDGEEAAKRLRQLTGRREKLMADLVKAEQDHRAGKLDREKYERRREDLMVAVEHVYAELDSEDLATAKTSRAGASA